VEVLTNSTFPSITSLKTCLSFCSKSSFLSLTAFSSFEMKLGKSIYSTFNLIFPCFSMLCLKAIMRFTSVKPDSGNKIIAFAA
jgi:hypothetical protein